MNDKIKQTLEFTRVKDLFSPFLSSENGHAQLRELEPALSLADLEREFAYQADMMAILVEAPHFAMAATKDISQASKRLELEADLNVLELLEIKEVLQSSHRVKDFYEDLENVTISHLARLFENLVSFPSLEGQLAALSQPGYVEDFASEKLLGLRRKMKEIEDQQRQLMQGLLKSQGDKLNDQIIASRNGRPVLPVKNTFRNHFPGVVHDISSSGSTIYIEPRQAVELNENLSRAQAEERHEIAEILRTLSENLRPFAGQIANNAWILGRLDLILAKCRFMQDYKASLPTLSKKKGIRLLNVRHPLIANAVANDLYFDEALRGIIITGPNTGGKTIMLKTLGLAQVMAQAGLPILADEGSQVGLFKEIFADIGDEQSIEQNLSTFSSHMTNIVTILEQATSDSLVLLDELGSGTDPQEGAGLAMAILDHLEERGIKVMATTHYPELKAYGLERKGMENASMEFDIHSLQPTYRFLQGVPGRSNAFDIAKRLGLNPAVVSRASDMAGKDSDVSQMILELEKQTLSTRKRLDKIEALEEENGKFNHALKKLYRELNREKDNLLDKAAQEAQEIIDKALEESDQILKNLQDKSLLKPHEIIEAKGQLKQLAPERVDLSQNKVLQKAKKERKAKIGDEIIVTAYGQRGSLINQLKDGRWEAQVGLIKMTLTREEFGLVKAEKEQTPKKRQVNVVKRANSGAAKGRLDLRGKRYEEAMQELDAFIDQALLNNLAQVDIIHGIGTGVIREGVTKYLRRNKHVKSFDYAPQNAGGSGATIVVFK